MMRETRRYLLAFVFLFLFAFLAVREAPAETEAEDKTREGVVKHGFVHNIAEDRRVEKVGGIYEPEGLDKYLRRHIENLSRQISDLDTKLSRVETQLKEVAQLLKGPEKSGEGAAP